MSTGLCSLSAAWLTLPLAYLTLCIATSYAFLLTLGNRVSAALANGNGRPSLRQKDSKSE